MQSDDGPKLNTSSRPDMGQSGEAPPWLFENISEASKNGRSLYFLFIGSLGYITLAVLNTSDRSIILNDAVKLPIFDIALPLTVFFIVASVMSLCLFVFFQLYLDRLWGLVETLRQYPNIPKRRLYPWMLNIAEDPDGGFVGSLQRLVVTFSLWWIFPLVIGILSFSSIKTHKYVLSYTLATMPLACAVITVYFWRKYQGISNKSSCRKTIGPVSLIVLAVLFSCGEIFYVVPKAHEGIPWPDPDRVKVGMYKESWGTKFLRNWVSADLGYQVLVDLRAHDAETNEVPDGENAVLWGNLKQVHLEGANLAASVLAHADMRGAKLQGSYLEGANLEGALLQDSDLSNAILFNANLKGAMLTGAILRGASLLQADLRGADLRNAELSGANLRYAKLHGALLDGAKLTNADLLYADASDASLRESLLCKADLRFSNLKGADLSYANLYQAKLQRAFLEDASARYAFLVGAVIGSRDGLLQLRTLYAASLDERVARYLKKKKEKLFGEDDVTKSAIIAQYVLSAKGYYYGAFDGMIGPVTREALAKFQKANKLSVTRRLDHATSAKIYKIMIAPKSDLKSQYKKDLAITFQHGLDTAGVTFDELQRVLRDNGLENGKSYRSLQNAVESEGFREAIKRFQALVGLTPDGLLGPYTARRIGEVYRGKFKVLMPVKEAQQKLEWKGDYSGEVNGNYSDAFQRAVKKYQGINCLVPDGRIRKPTALSLYSVRPLQLIARQMTK